MRNWNFGAPCLVICEPKFDCHHKREQHWLNQSGDKRPHTAMENGDCTQTPNLNIIFSPMLLSFVMTIKLRLTNNRKYLSTAAIFDVDMCSFKYSSKVKVFSLILGI